MSSFLFFADKASQIHLDLDSDIGTGHVDVTLATACPFSLDSFQFVGLEDVDKVPGMVRGTSFSLDPCPFQLITYAKVRLTSWLAEVINASLKEGFVPS